MKIVVYIEDGVTQLVLTPENKFEKNAIASFANSPTETKIFEGQFYDCMGGWTRQNGFYKNIPDDPYSDRDRSLIIRVSCHKEAA